MKGALSPGERLLEVELANSFRVSRATVREALRLLQLRGLVQIRPQKGAYITQLSSDELQDLFEVRAALLAAGSRLAAARCNTEDIQDLKQLLTKLSLCLDDVLCYVDASGQLISRIMEISGNTLLGRYVNDFAPRIGRYARMGLSTRERREQSLSVWHSLIQALEEHDGEKAARIHRELALQNRGAALDVLLNKG